MKPDQVRERMELFGLGVGTKESDVFLRDVCDAYEDLFYKLVEKEDKVSALNDAVRYYKNMEDNMAQMLSTISQISEKTENAAEKTAKLTIKEAEGKADSILADASREAAQILEDAKAQAQEILKNAENQTLESKEELKGIKAEFEAYAVRFYDFIETQKAFFEEHKIDVEAARGHMGDGLENGSQTEERTAGIQTQMIVPVQVEPAVSVVAEGAAAIVHRGNPEEVTVNQIRKIPNNAAHKEPTIEEIQSRIPEEIRNIPISDHTETLDEIIQSIKKSYEEVEHR